ncbi:hypothetical protein J5N97_009916 [Dioscorea zingiberensis]|uniref:RING-type domain-containing protein n=1 Tax=Dioscorea zingiberensis TaxID=325984 RepID=A0A9D5HMC6_9LILI|nr:hypothetical protein J5N97_009916 [Dioscorea zingiberensis]
MLPGVELARRRRVHHHNYEIPRRGPQDPTGARAASPRLTDMDEPALLARARLEEKLRRFSGPPRWASGAVVMNERERISEANMTKRIINGGKRTSGVLLQRRDSRVDVCAVCLDEVEGGQRTMKLPCSHKYHSDCLLPWLANHSQCPCCRTAV